MLRLKAYFGELHIWEIGDGLAEPSEHEYESDGLTNMRKGDRDVQEITRRFRGCKHDLYSLEYWMFKRTY